MNTNRKRIQHPNTGRVLIFSSVGVVISVFLYESICRALKLDPMYIVFNTTISLNVSLFLLQSLHAGGSDVWMCNYVLIFQIDLLLSHNFRMVYSNCKIAALEMEL